jgi:hypothetical protein
MIGERERYRMRKHTTSLAAEAQTSNEITENANRDRKKLMIP